VSEPLEPESLTGDTEEVDALLVESDEQLILRRAVPLPAQSRGTIVPAVQAVAVAATGFVAGAAVVGLVGRHQRRVLAQGAGAGSTRRLARGRGGRGRPEVLQVVSTRSLLVDVHVLGSPGEQR
jgi:hypothetical protein